jgi:hypothetical protein
MKVYINNGPNGVGLGTDYTRYVIDGSLSVEDSLNVPTLITFQLSNIDQLFVVPRRSSYVTVISEIYAPNGGYGSGKILATGFVTTEPERTFLGLSQGIESTTLPPNIAGSFRNQIYTYNVNVTSDEWVLNANTVPFIPAFVNQTDSQILAAIAQALMPGFFTTTQMASGNIVPYYQYDPTQTWSDIAKTFGDANRYHYKVINRSIIYQPFGDRQLGIAYDDTTMKEKNISPLELKTGVLTVPPVNDCIVLGDTEPQTNWDDYFVGDGFTTNFGLKHQVFDGTTTELLNDDWTEAQFTQGEWVVNDPENVCILADGNGNPLGALNIVQKGSPLQTYLPSQFATFIQAQNGLELGGGINLQHGQFIFNDTASGGGGLVGAVFPSSTFTPGNCLCGFGITGQQSWAQQLVKTVVILNGNTNQVELYVSGDIGPIQPGYVLSCSGFTFATFLNNNKFSVQSVQTINDANGNFLYYIITVVSAFQYSFSYSASGADTGIVQALINDVLVTASGAAGIVIQPIYLGQFVGQPVVSQINHQYVLQTWIGANAPTRFTRQYGNLTRSQFYGGQNLAASGAISWVVTDVNLGNFVIEQQNPLFGLFPSAPPPVITKFTLTNTNLPPFALYCLINGVDLNISINYTILSLPPQGYLTVQSLTGSSGGNLPWLPSELSPPIVYQIGFGMINQTAQISQQGEVNALAFYTDDIPAVGSRIRFLSWSAGQSIARVRDTAAVLAEAAISGDSGVRSAIMTSLSPLPRSSDECEAAAAASIIDREYPQFQGTYTVVTIPYKFENLYSPSMYDYPKTGEFFWINSPVRGVSGQNFFVNTVRVQIIELKQEVLNISVDYGPDLYLEKLLPSFLENEQNLLVQKQTTKTPAYITLGEVLNAYLPTLDNAQVTGIVNSLTGNYVSIDLGAPPITACEVRSVDSGWGIANQGRIGLFTTQKFTVPRTTRDQTWYLRALNNGLFSRFSKALRVNYPLIPSPPVLKQIIGSPGALPIDASTIVLDYNGDVRDIYGLELRAAALSGVNFYVFPDDPSDQIAYFTRQALPNTFPFNPNGNVQAIYSPPGSTTPPTQFQVGDVVLNTCAGDASFSNLVLCTDSRPGGTTNIPASGFAGAGGYTAYANPRNAIDGIGSTYSEGFGEVAIPGGSTSVQGREIWFGFGPDLGISPKSLTIQSSSDIEVEVDNGGGTNHTDGAGTITLENSFDGGVTWSTIYAFSISLIAPRGGGNSQSFFQNRLDQIPIPAGQDIGKIQVRATYTANGAGLVANGDDVFVFVDHKILDVYVAEGGPYNRFAWFDNGYTIPDANGTFVLGQANYAGTSTLYNRGTFSPIASGSISGNIATIYTPVPHGYNAGQKIINGCAWLPPAPSSQNSLDGAPMCGQGLVSKVIDSFTFQIQLNNYTRGNVPLSQMVGATTALPTDTFLGGNGGVLVQRPVFAPSDLVIDLTQPDIAAALSILEAINGNNRVSGLDAFFFNLTWDYSSPFTIPSFTVPVITGLQVDQGTGSLTWGVAQGTPDGHRVETFEIVSGFTASRFTVDHPNNPQLLRQAPLPYDDLVNPRIIKVTPFDAVGDGIPQYITWYGASGGLLQGPNPLSYTIGCTYDGAIPTAYTMVRIPYDQAVQYAPGFTPSQAYLEIAPTNKFVFTIFKRAFGTTTDVAIGTITFLAGSKVGIFGSLSSFIFNVGDLVKVVSQGAIDSTAFNFGMTLSGTKYSGG